MVVLLTPDRGQQAGQGYPAAPAHSDEAVAEPQVLMVSREGAGSLEIKGGAPAMIEGFKQCDAMERRKSTVGWQIKPWDQKRSRPTAAAAWIEMVLSDVAVECLSLSKQG